MQIKITQILSIALVLLNMLVVAVAEDGRLMDSYPPDFKAQNFSLFDVSGNKHELTDFRGKFVLVNFWALSCNVCKNEMTTLQSAYELINDEHFIVVSIHAGDDVEGARSVVNLNKITYPVLMDMDLQLGDWGIPILPTSFFVDPDGNILYRAVGTRVWNSPFMIDFIENVLKRYNLKVSQNVSMKY